MTADRIPRMSCLVLAGLLVSFLAPAGQAAAQHVDRGEVVHFDIARGRIVGGLPFDVDFYLLTPIPTDWQGTSEIRAVLQPNEKAGDACAFQPTLRSSYPLCKRFPDTGSTCALEAKRVMAKTEDGTNPVGQVEITVPALAVKQDYCLGVALIREPTPTEALEISQAIRSERRSIVSRLENSARPIMQSDLDRICESLEQAVRNSLAAPGVEPVLIEGAQPVCDPVENFFQQIVLDFATTKIYDRWDKILDELVSIQRVASADAAEPMKTIAGLDTDEKLERYLLGGPLPAPGTVPTEKWARDARAQVLKRMDELKLENVDCSREDAEARVRLACLANHQLFALEGDLHDLGRELNREAAVVADQLDALADRVALDFDIGATTWQGFEGRFRWYLSVDEGVAYGWDVNETFTYTGVNVYTRPVNKKAPLDLFHGMDDFRRRFAFIVGVSNTKVSESDVPGIEPIFQDRFVLVGAGVRLTDHVRFAAGVLLFDELDPDPLVDESQGLAHTPFASFSLDFDLVSFLQNQLGLGSGDD